MVLTDGGWPPTKPLVFVFPYFFFPVFHEIVVTVQQCDPACVMLSEQTGSV